MDELTLRAKIVDDTKGTLKEIQKSLKETAAAAKATHTEATKHAREHAKAQKELHEQLGKIKERVADALVPALATLGITAFSVGEALGQMFETLKKAGESYNVLNDAARRSGASVGYVDAITTAFARLGIPADQARQSISAMGDHLAQLQRGAPQEMNRLTATFSTMLPAIRETLRGAATAEERITRLFAFAANHPEIPPDKMVKFFGALGAPAQLATKNLEEWQEALEKGQKLAREHPRNMEVLGDVDNAFSHLREAQQAFGIEFVNTFGPNAVKVIEGFANAIDALANNTKNKEVGVDKRSIYGRLLERFGFHGVDNTPQGRLENSFKQLNDKKSEESIERGTAKGFLDAWRELHLDGGDAGGFIKKVAFHPGGGDGGGRARGGYFGSKDYPALDPNTAAGMGGTPGGSSGGSAGGGAPGDFKSSSMAGINAAAMAQLRREGVPEGNLKYAAALLTGQAIAESALKSQYHDGGNIKSIFGADRPRSAAMVRWLKAQGLDPNNPADQMKYMAHSVFAGEPGHNFAASKNALMNANPETFARGAFTLGQNFESPRFHNYQTRLKYSHTALKAGSGAAPASAAVVNETPATANRGFNDMWDNRALRKGAPTFDERWNDRIPLDLLQNGKRSGLMGGSDQALKGSASLKIDLNGFPRGTRTSSTHDGLFKEVKLNRGRAMASASQDS